jgi:putative DNA primase/helicase
MYGIDLLNLHKAGRLVLVTAAGALASSMGITGWDAEDVKKAGVDMFNRWMDDQENTGLTEEQKLISKVRKFIVENGAGRFSYLKGPNSYKTVYNRAGYISADVNGEVIYLVMPESFREICAGFNHRWAIKILLAAGILQKNSDGHAMHSHRLPGSDSPKKVYIFTHKVREDAEPVEINESSETC